MGLQALGGVAGGLQEGMVRNARGRQQQEQQEQQANQQQLQEILTMLQLLQQPGVDVLGEGQGPASAGEVPPSQADLLAGLDMGGEGGGGRLASAADLPPGEATAADEAAEPSQADLLQGLDFTGEAEPTTTDTARELGNVELAGEERSILFDPEARGRAATAEARASEQKQRRAFDLLQAAEPDQFTEFVPGFDYLSELDEVMSEQREEARTGREDESDELLEARRDRAFRMLRGGQTIEQAAEATGLSEREVGEVAKEVRQLDEGDDLPTKNVLDMVDPQNPFEEEVARRIARGQTRAEILEAIQRDIGEAARQEGVDPQEANREAQRLTEQAQEVFSRLDEERDLTISGDFESISGLFRGAGGS